MTKRLTQEEWIAASTEVKNGKYTYQDVVYLGGRVKVEITCPEHGNFWQQAASHKDDGKGCPECGRLGTIAGQILGDEGFIEKSTKLNGERYDYSLVNYVNSKTPVTIICREHGKFSCLPNDHLQGHHCPTCGRVGTENSQRGSKEDMVRLSRPKHGDTYNYDLVEYVNMGTKVKITCKTHGTFMQQPDNHIAGAGCPHCGKSGYNRLKPGTCYILRAGNVTKVGITNRSPKTRIREVKNTGAPAFEVHSSFYFEDGNLALNLETNLLRHLEKTHSRVDEVYQGSTECFYDVDLQALTDFIVTPSETNNRPISF